MTNQLLFEIDQLNKRIEAHEEAWCGVIESLQRGDIKAALNIATQQLVHPEDRPTNDPSGFAPRFDGKAPINGISG
jgi:hypothetical protein